MSCGLAGLCINLLSMTDAIIPSINKGRIYEIVTHSGELFPFSNNATQRKRVRPCAKIRAGKANRPLKEAALIFNMPKIYLKKFIVFHKKTASIFSCTASFYILLHKFFSVFLRIFAIFSTFVPYTI